MFDFAWSELGLIAVVAMIFIGPKDMPVAIRSMSGLVRKARRMAAEFQTHVDEMVREADLGDIRKSINEIRNYDIRGEIEKAVDSDGTLRATITGTPPEPSVTAFEEIAVAEPAPAPEEYAAVPAAPVPGMPQAPAFVPPNLLLPGAAGPTEPEPPAFIPPEIVQHHRARAH